MKSSTQLLDDKLRTFNKECRSVSSLISFGKIKTVGDALEKLGAADHKLEGYSPEDTLNYHKFQAIIPQLKFQLITAPLIIDSHPWESYYSTSDFIQESYLEKPTDLKSEIEPYADTYKETPCTPFVRAQIDQSVSEAVSKQSQYGELVMPYLPPLNPQQKASLFYFQQHAANEIFYKLIVKNEPSILMRANTGDGKTYVYGQIIRWLFDNNWFEGKTFSPYPVMIVTAASIVEQTQRVMENKFGLNTRSDVLVTNYDSLRASFGERILKEETYIEEGYEHTRYVWYKFLHPCLVIWDECQKLKNVASQQSGICQAFNDIPLSNITKQIYSSATPFARIAGAKCFAVSTRVKFRHGTFHGESILTNKNWNEFAGEIAQGNIFEYNKAAVKRLLRTLDHWITGFKNVRRKHHAINNTEIIQFETKDQKQEYDTAFLKYLEAKARIEGNDSINNGALLILVELQKFRQAAEFIRAPILARRIWESIQKEGKQVVVACCYKPTIAKIVSILVQDYNIPRERISLIWGGNDAFSSAKKISIEEIKDTLRRVAMGEILPTKLLKQIAAQATAEQQGLDELPKELNLGNQSRDQRQKEIDKFQSGDSDVCIFTFGAGGAGLSLHHTNEYFEDHPERYRTEKLLDTNETFWFNNHTKKYVETKPRRTFLTPTYNEMELEQGLGRAPRLTSLSDTVQTILLFAGTVEVAVLARVNQKRVCLTEVIKYTEKDEILAKQITELAGSGIRDDEEDENEGAEIYEEYDKEKQKE